MAFIASLRLFLVMFLLSIEVFSEAAVHLPKNLNESDRTRALEILGFGSAPKILDNPYPLGGYSGIEFGFGAEYIPLEDLSSLGATSTDRGELGIYTLSFAKGLYYNVDLHLQFTPFIQSDKVQTYGGQFRWGFYESSFFPLSLSTVISAGGANFSNLINITTLGVDLIGSVHFDNVSLYFGGGQVRATGKFIGGADGITDTQETYVKNIVDTHTVFGVNIDVARFFLAMEVDRYVDSIYSAKVGLRY